MTRRRTKGTRRRITKISKEEKSNRLPKTGKLKENKEEE